MSLTPSQRSDQKTGNEADIRHSDTVPVGRSDAVRAIARSRSVLRWGLAAADVIGILIGIAIVMETGKLSRDSLGLVLLSVPIWIFTAKLYNLYDRDHRRIQHSTFDEMPQLLATAAITVVVVKVITVLFDNSEALPSAVMIMVAGLAFLVAVALRGLVRATHARIAAREKAILVGSGGKSGQVAKRLQGRMRQGLDLIGFVADSSESVTAGELNMGIDYLGPSSQLADVAVRKGATRVVIAEKTLTSKAISGMISDCRRVGLAVTMVPAHQELMGPETELNRFAGVPMLDFHFSIPPRSTLAIKRALDITLSGALLAFSSPVLLVSAVLIKLDSRGPVFFRQVRISKDGKSFTMFKLRTMDADAESKLDELIDLDALDEPAFKIPDDPRITRIGKFLRRTSLDEIPQFINVLRGDMSLVGPRPEEKAVVALYDERQRQRLSVKPGLTGPMQVYGRGSLSFEERLALERDYVDNLTISGDIAILLRTPQAVIKGDGAH